MTKFAEICAAVVLGGETSLTSVVLHGDWVISGDKLRRSPPTLILREPP